MTSHKDQIQALINEIDSVLDRPSPRLLSAMAGGGDQQRLVLEQTRSYLSNLQRDLATVENPGSAISTAPFQEQSAAESAQQVLQAVLQEMSYLRTNFMQPLRQDVEGLQQQREALTQEIRQLETQRQQYLLPQQTLNQQQLVSEFLQSLMGRLQEQLTGQVAQMLTGLETQTLQERSLMAGASDADGTLTDLSHPYQSAMTPQQRLEQVQMLQAQSDQLLLKLDSTLGVIFESLQSNIQSYQESLTQGLDKMQSLGQQGEAMFAALVNRLAQQLGREASTYLQSSLQTTDWDAAQAPRPASYIPPQASTETAFPGEVLLPLQPFASEEISDEQIDLLLNELTVGEPATVIQLPDDDEGDLSSALELPFTAESLSGTDLGTDSVTDSDSFDTNTLDLSSLELMQLPPATAGGIDADDDITFFQLDQPLTSFQMEDDDFARLQDDLELATSTDDAADVEAGTDPADEINDIDSALDLLTQLSAELQTEPVEPLSYDGTTADMAIAADEEAIAPSQERYDDEMSDLYQSLFGMNAQGLSGDLADNLTDQHIADANLAAPMPTEEPSSGRLSDRLEGDISPMAATALGDELFGGLIDPAQTPDAIAPSDDASADLDDLDADLAEALFAGEEDALTEAHPAVAGDIDAIASLSDLIESPLPDMDNDLAEMLYAETAVEPSEDTFIPAAPDEVLLVTEEASGDTRRDMSIDADTINQLTADLSSFEGLETSPVSYLDADLELTEGAWTLDDLGQQLSPMPPAEESGSLEDEVTELMASAPPPQLPPEPSSEPTPDASSAVSIEDLAIGFPPSPTDYPIPFDLDESSEITEIIEPRDIEPRGTEPRGTEPRKEAIAPSSSESPTDASTSETPFSFDENFDEYDDLDLDTPPTDLDDLFERLVSTSELYSNDTDFADAVELTPDELVAAADFDQADPLSSLEDFDLSASSRHETVRLPENAEDFALEDLFSALGTSSNADSSTEESGMTLGEFGESLDSFSEVGFPEAEEESLLEELFPEAAVNPSRQLPNPTASDLTASDLSLGAFSEALPLPLMPPLPNTIPPASAALHASDTAAPSPSIPLDDEATIEDLFAAATPLEPAPVQPSESGSSTAPEPLEPVTPSALEDEDEVNAFTLEGMVDLFEGAPSIEPSNWSEATALQSRVENDEKKKTLAPEPSTDSDAATIAGLDWIERLAVAQPLDAQLDTQLLDTSLGADEAIRESETWLSSLGLDPFAAVEAAVEPPIVEPPVQSSPTESPLAESAADTTAESAVAESRLGESPALEARPVAEPQQERIDEESPVVSDRVFLADATSEMLAVSEELGIDPRELEALLDSDFSTDDFFPPLPPPPPDTFPKVWYLGLDLGTTGISAVLLNRLSGELHPIYWSYAAPSPAEQGNSVGETLFRLPTRVSLSTDEQAIDPSNVAPGLIPQGNLVHVSFVPPATRRSANKTATGSSEPSSDFLLHDFKPYLKLGIPYYSPETSCWEPVLQWSDHHQISLSPVHQALRVLMTALSHTLVAPATSGVPRCGAIGLEEGALQAALSQLAGVIVGCPVNWPDTYRFNIREAVLGARLVTHPDQIFMVEDVIATLLSGLRSADGRSLMLPHGLAQKPNLHNADWQGSTLVINAGASTTDLALVDLPEQLANLSYQDFHLRGLSVAGNTLDQDIVCQLIYPAWLDQTHGATGESNPATVSYTFGAENGAKPEPFDRHTHSSDLPDQMGVADLNQLGLSNLPLPLPGEPDLQTRFRLQQRLESSALGQALLEAARYVKLNLQQQDQLTLKLCDRHLVMTRQDLGSRVFLPFIQRLNREINALLSQSGVSVLTVNQVICTGGTASLGAIARWLREKFPNATIIQDTYSGNRAPSPQDNCLPTCSRVAYGLATLPLHPQVPDLARQQYSDYFLLLEVLRTFPDEPISVGDIMQRLERRGVHTEACYTQILALLEGHLPPGLVPTAKDAYLLTPESRQNPDYQMLLAAPLFHKQNNQTYRPNYEQWNHFRRYLSTIMTSTYQKLTEPLSISLVL